jgi:hypothetical protein
LVLGRWKRLLPALIRAVLCRILDMNFREFQFHALCE